MAKIKCFHCKKTVDRQPSQVRRSKRHFCSRSCAVTVHNAEKPKRQKQAVAPKVVRCVLCENVIPDATLARRYCDSCRRQRNIDRTTQYRRDLKKRAIEHLGGSCVRCGYNKSTHALEFHHRDSLEKDFTISAYANLSWRRVVKEIDKCDLLCANCHREVHDPAL